MERYQETNKVSIYGIIGNILLLLLKGIVGFLSNSQAMIADFFNSFGDVFSSLMTFIGNKISKKEADEDHNLGHGKAEYVYAFLISIIMILTSYSVVKGSIDTYLRKEKITFSYLLLGTAIVTIIVKLSLYFYTKSVNKKHPNILIEASCKDHRNDCFITTLTVVSSILGINGFYEADIIVGIIIGLWIFYTGWKIFKESYDVLMDKSMNEDTKDKVYEIIRRHQEVLKVNHFNATPVGYR